MRAIAERLHIRDTGNRTQHLERRTGSVHTDVEQLSCQPRLKMLGAIHREEATIVSDLVNAKYLVVHLPPVPTTADGGPAPEILERLLEGLRAR